MSTFGIAAIQMDASSNDNIERMGELLAETKARFPWVRMVVFSELCAFGTATDKAQPLPGPAETAFCSLARQHNLWLIPGSLLERAEDKLYNTLSVIKPDGTVAARYRKIYPWYPYESAISGGDKFVCFDVDGVGRFGVLICYDMMIPETARQLAFMGAEVILHPLMTTTLDRKQELVIAQANAIANQCYFIDVNGAGSLGVGRSQIIGPEGDLIHVSGEREEIMAFRVDMARVRDVRTNGTAGTVQALKTFRDSRVKFPAYEDGAVSATLQELGPLSIPQE